MDLVSPVIDILTRLWDCTAQCRGYVCYYELNLQSLSDAVEGLQSVKGEVERRVEREVQQDCYLKCAERVEIWLGAVIHINDQVVGILERGDAEAQNKCFGANVLPYDQSLSDIALLQELECLQNISDISLTLSTLGSVLKFKASSKLQCCIKRLTIMCSELGPLDISSSTMKRMEHLDTLSIRDCHSLTELKISFEEQGRMQGSKSDCFHNLRYLHIENCSIKDLTWLRYATTLRYLWVDNCPSLEEIIADDFGSSEIEENMDILSKIESINLVSLPSLKSICRRAVLFPCLQNLEVINCPSLRKLPFESGNARNSLKAIKGSKTWWDQLEWDDATTKDAFASKFFYSDFVLFKPTVHSDYTKNLLR
ncbi:hypothetical protein Q3G72_006589 [Acer saccharum]|nr:hypothetical protein Q3G72_006589 [Acer saccharum]